jgi:hypothetical protein
MEIGRLRPPDPILSRSRNDWEKPENRVRAYARTLFSVILSTFVKY